MVATVAGVRIPEEHWIDGSWVGSPARFLDHSPLDEEPVAELARGGAAEIDAAVQAAHRAFRHFSRTTREERAALLHAIAEEVLRRLDHLAAVETVDSGGLLRTHLRVTLPKVAHVFRFFADRLLELHHPDFHLRAHRNHVSWEPAGVCGLITPWNTPLFHAAWRLAPALAAGNTVVLKPPAWAPLTAALLCRVAADAGLPDGVLNLVHGTGDEAGAALAAHPRLARLAFTGAARTGRLVAAAAGQRLTPVSLELGGSSPLVVFADCELDRAVAVAVGQYDHAGQGCLSATRLLVEQSAAEEFTTRFLLRANTLRQGDPRDVRTDVGPQIHREHLDRVDAAVSGALAAGARPLLGGRRNDRLGGLYYRPTLLANPPPGAEVLTEEVLGPVLTLQTFTTETEALALANDGRHGLAATVFTGSPDRARRVAGALAAGTVWVNCSGIRDLRAPYGGARESGIGRGGGQWSFDFFCDVKNSVFSPDGWSG
ncbi:5-carboxymethyl-2-hydroxymuconic-semialdehyde dehydrogenase [Crossiella equi]|uniref:5-carboxymethyl-2-hydroxymuconic-semialdehyde dehydrogenase n=1 Tax=Crossiella equi TaxID=130796 RepID=A0ABS5ABM6_9PSEU|nr:aldehyde dehydrogenase family protein [Crossiella equi]MBP2473604.1 5-carboxymethyl-2-hydroxymuconic-semialdehyde dehydrogenase [Crossiella equi]